MSSARMQPTVFADLRGRAGPRRGEGPLDEAAIRDLAAFTGRPVVTSLYLDIDGRTRPAPGECDTALAALFRRARRRAETLDPPAGDAVEQDLAAIEAWIAAGVDRSRTRGLALFSCAGEQFLRAFRLPVAVRDGVSVGPHPDVGQLEEIVGRARPLLVVLVDSEEGRLLEARLDMIREVGAVADPVERQVDTDVEIGSWERRREEALRRHLRRVAAAVTRRVDSGGTERLVVGGPTPVAEELVDLLPARVSTLLAGRIAVALGDREEIHRAVSEMSARLEDGRQAGLVEEVRTRIGRGEAVAGLEASLEALNDRRVRTLLLDHDYAAPGRLCPSCGHLGTGAGECPWCGSPTESLDDVVDLAVERALAQQASVELVSGHRLDDVGHIAAFERHH